MSFIGLDWGSSHVRALLLDEQGSILDRREAPLGSTRVGGEWQAALDSLTSGWPARECLACGMIGSREGWVETGYLDAPADAAAFAAALVDAGPVEIVPGLRGKSPVGRPDVMRGEETQLLGLLGDSALAPSSTLVLPGTHSKWVRAEETRVATFATVISGELFELLGSHSLLAGPMKEGRTRGGSEPDSLEAFARGVEASASSAPLVHELFAVRAAWAQASGELDPASFVSGLLIGAEVRAMLPLFPSERIELVGRGMLARRYALALERVGVASRLHDGEAAVARGLAAIWRLKGPR